MPANLPLADEIKTTEDTRVSHVQRISFLYHERADFQRSYAIMGEKLIFQTNDASLLAVADQAFGRFPISSIDNGKEPLILALFVHSFESSEKSTLIRPEYHTQGHLFSMQIGPGNHAVADLKNGYAFGFITKRVTQDQAFVRYNFLETLGLAMLGLSRGYFVIHAACVVKDGTSVLLHGKAGSGKSTLAYACARRGYQLLSEDAVQVKALSTGTQFWGAPWKLHLLPDARRFFPELRDCDSILQTSGEWKIEIDLESLYPGCTISRAEPGVLVFLERGDQNLNCIHPIDRAQALKEFEVIWSWETGWNERMEEASQELLANGAYRLYINGSPDEAVNSLDALLASR